MSEWEAEIRADNRHVFLGSVLGVAPGSPHTDDCFGCQRDWLLSELDAARGLADRVIATAAELAEEVETLCKNVSGGWRDGEPHDQITRDRLAAWRDIEQSEEFAGWRARQETKQP